MAYILYSFAVKSEQNTYYKVQNNKILGERERKREGEKEERKGKREYNTRQAKLYRVLYKYDVTAEDRFIKTVSTR